MNLQKVKIWSGIVALVSLISGTIMLVILRDFLLPEEYGAITFETYHGFGALTLSLWILFLASAGTWIVLMFTDTNQPDILDRKTMSQIILVSGSFCFVTGLAFYTDYYFLLSFFMPMTSGFYIDYCYRRRFPASLLRVYTNLSVLVGMIMGYIVASFLVWNKLDDMTGTQILGGDTFSQEFSVVRIGIFILIYVFMSFVGMLIGEQRRIYQSSHFEEEYPMLIKPEIKNILATLAVLAICLLIIHLIPWEGRFYLFWDVIAVFWAIIWMSQSVLRLIALYGKG